MRRHTRVRPEFWEDLIGAIDFYNSKSQGLGEEFAQEVVVHVRRAADSPEAYPIIRKPYRRVLLRRFGQLIIYAAEEERLFFLGIVHGARHFGRWLKARG